jgi:hypothetical protein
VVTMTEKTQTEAEWGGERGYWVKIQQPLGWVFSTKLEEKK